jgi:membrane-associated phospholipid phosphatase
MKAHQAVTLAYIAVVSGLVFGFRSRVPQWWVFLIMHAAAVALLLAVVRFGKRRDSPAARMLSCWYVFIFIPPAFHELHYLVHAINPVDLDLRLIAIDRAMFGCDPAVAMERIAHPLLTDILQVVYSTFYFLPLILGIPLYISKKWDAFDESMNGLTLGFYSSYLGYFLVPAIGPRFTQMELFSTPHPVGLFVTGPIRSCLDTLEFEMRDCFPSGHTEVMLIVLWFAWKFHKRSFWILLPIACAMIFATVYLRYHYVIDLIAAAVFAAAVIPLATWLHKKWSAKGTTPSVS